MLKNFFSGGTQRLFLCIVMLCILGIVIMGGYSWNVMSDAMFDQIEKTSRLQMQRANQEFDNLTNEIKETVSKIESLKPYYENEISAAEADMNGLLAQNIDAETFGAIFLVTSDGREYSYNPDVLYVDMVHLRISCHDNNPESRKLNWYNGSSETFFSRYSGYYIVCTSVPEKENAYATLYLFIKEEHINKALRCVHDRNNVVMLLEGGNILATSDEERLKHLTKTTEGILFQLYEEDEGFFEFKRYDERLITSHFRSADSDFKFMAVYETAEIFKESYKILSIMFIFMAGFILIIVILYWIIKKQYIKPFSELVEQMKNTENDLTDKYIDIRGNQEISVLVRQYNKMRHRIFNILEDVKKHEEMKRQAEVAALRYQINPHFFYNTLSNIKMLALSKGEYEISDTISKFANMYRYLFSNKSNFVMLGEEIEFIKNYISLMSTRYDNLLNTFYMVDEHLKECKLPVFILQPLVENAIVHGLSKKLNERTACFLRITVTAETDNLVIEIHDNGKGMSAEMIEKIMAIRDTETQEFGLGLFNTIKRLKYQYGERYSFSVESEQDEYTKITLKIPVEFGQNGKQ